MNAVSELSFFSRVRKFVKKVKLRKLEAHWKSAAQNKENLQIWWGHWECKILIFWIFWEAFISLFHNTIIWYFSYLLETADGFQTFSKLSLAFQGAVAQFATLACCSWPSKDETLSSLKLSCLVIPMAD